MVGSLLVGALELERKGIVFGVDEVGRGCLAGPVVAACVAFDWSKPEVIFELNDRVVIRDSKRMSRLQRSEAAKAIREVALCCGVGEVDAVTIDQINILQATYEAMRRAAANADVSLYSAQEKRYVIDGKNTVPQTNWEQTAIIRGDGQVFSIAAASIVAKEYRDVLMEGFHEHYPQYAFDQHKGYGTKAHYAAIAQHGITPLHRKTFLKKVLV